MPIPKRQHLPFSLDGGRMTEIIEEEIDAGMDSLREQALAAYPDGLFPGMRKLSARERLKRYIAVIALEDYSALFDPLYLDRLAAGQVGPPQSPFLQNFIAIPDDFKELAEDFRNLIKGAVGE